MRVSSQVKEMDKTRPGVVIQETARSRPSQDLFICHLCPGLLKEPCPYMIHVHHQGSLSHSENMAASERSSTIVCVQDLISTP